jgi:hypothetical protein
LSKTIPCSLMATLILVIVKISMWASALTRRSPERNRYLIRLSIWSESVTASGNIASNVTIFADPETRYCSSHVLWNPVCKPLKQESPSKAWPIFLKIELPTISEIDCNPATMHGSLSRWPRDEHARHDM